MIIPLTLLALAIACRSISELALHGKLKWSKDDSGFWGERSYYRKYANPLDAPRDNWYYRTFKIGYKERFLLSASFLVSLTDGTHLMQSLFFIFLSLSFSIATGLNFLFVWGGILLVHFVTYRIAQK